jgi:glycosyltransferase involved in cell wall biosynthesis
VTLLSAVLIVKDEEHRIGAALDSVAFCDERLVVDGGSRDRTRELAQARGARVVENVPWPGFVAQRTFATAAAQHDWVLALDADERVSPALREEILGLKHAGFGAAAYRIPRVTRYLGRWIRATDWYPDPQTRLFDRRRGRWQGGLVHESFGPDSPPARLAGEIEHEPYADVSEHLLTIDRYTTLWAEQARAAGRGVAPLEPELSAGWALLRNLVLKRGLLLGRVGLTVSVLNAFYVYTKLVKLREARRPA